MTSKQVFTLLGTGSSGGVPRVGNQWGKCKPDNPKNRRRRCAMLMESMAENGDKTVLLIDAGCDLREQLLSANVEHLDGVLITHPHADHIFGLDDLRQLALSLRTSIPVYMDDATAEVVMQAFGYCFRQAPGSSYPAFCTHKRIVHTENIEITGAGGTLSITPLLAEHGDIHALGFRVNQFAYLPDVKRVRDAASLGALKNLDTLVIDALRYKPHPSHMNLEDALAFIKEHQPRHSVLTNMHSDLDYDELLAQLPEGVEPGFDGMLIQ